ncbi:hypothetical protein [Streptomyces sp. PAN_FS17]|uniref:hypothetical protein n=1 Tax=Streptomyces sp. PAN_FS17 TaxID=1855351 RepID=UPI000894DACA|nr:hypothetical protein [Streptomyces sp. PAN_FS17]SEE09746.1 hypothetical protein SAMN05216482_9172 [Streptomyces sp. PAN_FS17]
MTITMQNFGFTWTDPDGTPRTSAVAYDKPTAEHRWTELDKAQATDIEIVPVRPGQLPDPKA